MGETLSISIPETERPKGQILSVAGIGTYDIAYNPAVIIENGQPVIALRVEHVASNWEGDLYNPRVQFYTRINNELWPMPNTPEFKNREDPFATWIKDANGTPELLFGVVKADRETKTIATQLFRAPSVRELDPNKPFMEIQGMKDIRFTQLSNGKIAVFTRPQHGIAYPGRIGFTIIDSIDQLSQEVVDTAPLLPILVDADKKIGPNEAHVVKDILSSGEERERIHVFCHVANNPVTKDDLLHYSAYEFYFDPFFPTAPISLSHIASREHFEEIPDDKKKKHGIFPDVIFPGGTGSPYHRELYVGVEDSAVGVYILN